MKTTSTLKWLTIGIGVKRWLLALLAGNILVAVGVVLFAFELRAGDSLSLSEGQLVLVAVVSLGLGLAVMSLSLVKLSRNLLAPYRRYQQGRVIDIVYAHKKRQKGIKVVALGGGTGLPSVLRGMKAYTSNITAVVTVADDGGSSGRLRRDLGVQPPGDIRNNIAALADDESLMTQLFQYRFVKGDLDGHAFGNLFIAALAGVSGGLETALPEVERVLNIQGRVLPATLEDVNLVADMRMNGTNRMVRVQGESRIGEMNGHIETISLTPSRATAFSESADAILNADLVVIGPGSLYTSILPNLLVDGITQALRQTTAHKVYVCNVATQPGETENYTVAEHILAIEKHLGTGVFHTVIANNATPAANKNTHYVPPVPEGHELLGRYDVIYADLTDSARPWRHDPQKLANVLTRSVENVRMSSSGNAADPVLMYR